MARTQEGLIFHFVYANLFDACLEEEDIRAWWGSEVSFFISFPLIFFGCLLIERSDRSLMRQWSLNFEWTAWHLAPWVQLYIVRMRLTAEDMVNNMMIVCSGSTARQFSFSNRNSMLFFWICSFISFLANKYFLSSEIVHVKRSTRMVRILKMSFAFLLPMDFGL